MVIILDIRRDILIAADIVTRMESVLLIKDAIKVVSNHVAIAIAVAVAIHMTRNGQFLSEGLIKVIHISAKPASCRSSFIVL